ncbi:MAG: alpha/beta hydrolase [Rhodospirillales bacterium]
MQKASYLGLSVAGFHRLSYRVWGAPAAKRTLLCMHGLSRNGQDFQRLAEVLAEAGWRVVAPDVVGRGDSDWARSAKVYGYPQYLADMNALIARLEVESLDWLGTSMGGMAGMMLAGQPGTPIRRLILNDIGPFIPKASLERIADYVGQPVSFADRDAAEAYARTTYASFGQLDDATWRLMTEVSFRRDAEGRFVLAYDPAIAEAFSGKPIEDLDLWPLWDKIEQPTLVLRGADSDLLLAETAEEMTRRGPKAKLAVFQGCGHAPSLMEPQQIETVKTWLEG